MHPRINYAVQMALTTPRSQTTQPAARVILHVDMDAFYASVEVRDNPALRGRPVIVGGPVQGRGVVSAASYEVRRYGVHSAMPMVTALRLCPQAVCLAPRIDYYAAVSEQIHAIFARFTPQIEPLSLDEAFLDVTASARLFGSGEKIAQAIKQAIQQELQLVASVGVAPSKFVAKVASDIEKPDALVSVRAEQVQAFLDPLPVSRLWGAGKTTVAVFERMGVRTIAQVRSLSEQMLLSQFGKWGTQLWQLAHGHDPRPVISDGQAKSISHENTFAQDVSRAYILETYLLQLTEQVAARLRQQGLQGKTVQLKLRYPDFKTITRARTLDNYTDSTTLLWQVVKALLHANWSVGQPIRLIGMGVSQFQNRDNPTAVQGDLFMQDDARQRTLDTITDTINAKFGAAMLHRGRFTVDNEDR